MLQHLMVPHSDTKLNGVIALRSVMLCCAKRSDSWDTCRSVTGFGVALHCGCGT
jgi:hypothetical protein